MKLAVRYDKNLKEEVFVVKDDESYVSSTKTILTVTDPVLESEYNYQEYGVDVTINVLRDVGASKIVLHDGDDVLESFDWNGTMISKHYDFPIGTAHKLKAVFKGNRQCLGSQSKSFDVFMRVSGDETHILYTGDNVISTETSFPFELVDKYSSHIPSGNLTVSYMSGSVNDVQEETVLNGFATVDFSETLPNVASGLINLTAVYNGEGEYAPAMLEFQVSKYYTVTLSGYYEYPYKNDVRGSPRHLIGEDFILLGTIVDYMGDLYYKEGFIVNMYGFREGAGQWVSLGSGNIGTNGKFQLTVAGDDAVGRTCSKFKFGAGEATTIDEFNPVIEPPIVTVTRIDVTQVRVSGSNSEETFYVDVYGNIGTRTNVTLDNVPIHITNTAANIDDVYSSGTKGRATCTYAPTLTQEGFTLNIRAGTISVTHTIPYYLTYYDAPLWSGQDLGLEKVTTQTLQTGTQYNATPGGSISAIYADIPDDLFNYKQKWSYKVVSTTDNTFYYGLYGMNGEITVYGVPNDNWLGVGDTAEYVYDPANNSVVCTVNNRERFRDTISNAKRYPAIIRLVSNGSVVLDNIKHEVLPSL